MNIVYITQAKSTDLNHGTPILANQYLNLALKKNYNVCLLTPTYDEQLFYKTHKKNEIFYNYLPAIHNWSLNGFEFENDNLKNDLDLPFKPDLFHIIDLVNFDSQLLYKLKKYKIPIIRHICSFEDFCYFVTPVLNNSDNSLCRMKLDKEVCSECITKNLFKRLKLIKKIGFLLSNKKKKTKNNFENNLKNRNQIINFHLNEIYDYLIFASNDYADYYFSHTRNKKKEFSIIPHGIKKDLAIKKVKNEKINFIYTGGVIFNKGWDIIEKSFYYLLKKYSNKINLRVYGDKKKTLKSKIANFKNVELFDKYDHRDLNKILSWADIGIIPSYFDTYNLFLRELINQNVIPITSNFFSVSEIIQNNHNGIILNKNNKENLIKSVEEIINNFNFRNKLNENIKNIKIISDDEEFKKVNEIYEKFFNKSN